MLLGDPSKALSVLGWDPTKTPFVEVGCACYCLGSTCVDVLCAQLVKEMVDADVKAMELNTMDANHRQSAA